MGIIKIPGYNRIIMKNIIIGTTNPAKIAQIKDALAPLGIAVEGVANKDLLPSVIEDGNTAQENARKKALSYAKALRATVLSMDNALFFNGLAAEDQPGIHVRRIGGALASTDEELLEHGIALVNSLGGKAAGYWEYGICVADLKGNVWETTIRTPRVFTCQKSKKIVPDYPLESIQIDPETGRYISEMTSDEQALFWQKTLGNQLCEFVSKTITEDIN
jgi:XTP/dITP diphosphohydrolase